MSGFGAYHMFKPDGSSSVRAHGSSSVRALVAVVSGHIKCMI